MNDKINDIIDRFKKLDRCYYEACIAEDKIIEDGRIEIINLINELENLGVNWDYLRKIDEEIYCDVYEL